MLSWGYVIKRLVQEGMALREETRMIEQDTKNWIVAEENAQKAGYESAEAYMAAATSISAEEAALAKSRETKKQVVEISKQAAEATKLGIPPMSELAKQVYGSSEAYYAAAIAQKKYTDETDTYTRTYTPLMTKAEKVARGLVDRWDESMQTAVHASATYHEAWTKSGRSLDTFDAKFGQFAASQISTSDRTATELAMDADRIGKALDEGMSLEEIKTKFGMDATQIAAIFEQLAGSIEQSMARIQRAKAAAAQAATVPVTAAQPLAPQMKSGRPDLGELLSGLGVSSVQGGTPAQTGTGQPGGSVVMNNFNTITGIVDFDAAFQRAVAQLKQSLFMRSAAVA